MLDIEIAIIVASICYKLTFFILCKICFIILVKKISTNLIFNVIIRRKFII